MGKMIGFGFWDGSNNEFASVNDNVLNLLDFPMENLESDGFGEDLDEKLRSLGPIHSADLLNLLSQSNSSVQSEQTCHQNKETNFEEDSSRITRRQTRASCELPQSPVSFFTNSGSSCSSEKSDSLDSPSDTRGSRKSKRGKKPSHKLKETIKECNKATAKKKQDIIFRKKCVHCGSINTPQWRHGPMGKNTLCNACGVAYAKGRLLREYRRPTFIPDLNSNLPVLLSQSNSSVQTEQTCQTNKEAELDKDSSGTTHREMQAPREAPQSPISFFTSFFTKSGSSDSHSDTWDYKPSNKQKKGIKKCNSATANVQAKSLSKKKCLHCESRKTPQWRHGPMGKHTLCNACGVAYMKGRLLPEYRPAASPTFVPDLHSNLFKKAVKMRQGELDEENI